MQRCEPWMLYNRSIDGPYASRYLFATMIPYSFIPVEGMVYIFVETFNCKSQCLSLRTAKSSCLKLNICGDLQATRLLIAKELERVVRYGRLCTMHHTTLAAELSCCAALPRCRRCRRYALLEIMHTSASDARLHGVLFSPK